MGILSKIRERRESTDVGEEVKKEARKKKSVDSKSETTDALPEISDVNRWLKEIRKMSEDGIGEIDKFYKDIVGRAKDISDFVLNLGVIATNYLSFRYEVYSKLAEYYGDTNRAINKVDKVLKDVDEKFIDKLVGVIRKWMRS